MVGLVVLAGCSGRGEIIPTPSPEPQTPTTAGTQLSAAPTTVLAATTSTAAQVRRARPTTSTSQYLRVQTTTTPDPSAYEYGEWAIPAYIVMCESKGNWMAHNASGASGPYQLMPLHFGGALAMYQSRQAQHDKAAQLWNGGKGKHHWSACL